MSRLLHLARPSLVYANSKNGLLYNWYAATDARNIAPVGWHMPSSSEYETLMLQLDVLGTPTLNTAGGKMKVIGTVYWNSPNTNADNSSGFNCVGSGYRSELGIFNDIQNRGRFWNSNEQYSTTAFHSYCNNTNGIFNTSNLSVGFTTYKKVGNAVRLIKDDSTDTGTMVGTDGLTYRTVKIGTQVWMVENYQTKKYRDGSDITNITNQAAWNALTTGAWCAYNNDEAIYK